MKQVVLGIDGLTLEQLVAIARTGARVRLAADAARRISDARKLVDGWIKEEKTIYGVTTGFGALSDVAISRKDTGRLQENILRSHAAGVGEPLSVETVRAVLALRIKDLARGHSGIRLKTARQLIKLLNSDVIPVVPAKGSVGASGDLAPLAHLALVLIGEGEAFCGGKRISGRRALARAGLEPLALEAAEGLALVNGTQVMTAQ